MNKSWWQRFKATSAHNQANIVSGLVVTAATLAYSITAGIQLHVMRDASDANTKQTAQLITAANLNTGAAQRFADSAGDINFQISQAVDKLREQSHNTEELRKSTERQALAGRDQASKNIQTDLRAYMVLVPERGQVGLCNKGGNDVLSCLHFHLVNVGKTPAIDVAVDSVLYLPGAGGALPAGAMQNVLIPHYTGLDGSVVANGNPEENTAYGKTQLPACLGASYHVLCAHALYGLVRYKDIFGQKHETGFCLRLYEQSDRIEFCSQGNYFDKRPPGLFIEE